MSKQAQEIAVTCKGCGNKCRCTVPEWTAGFPCEECGAMIQRPAPKNMNTASPVGSSTRLPSGGDSVSGLMRETVSAKRVEPAGSIPSAPSSAASTASRRVSTNTSTFTASTSLNLTLERLRAENVGLKEKVKEITIALARNEAESDVVRSQHEESTKRLKDLQVELTEANRQREQLRDQVQHLSGQTTSLNLKVTSELATIRSARDEAESSLAKLQVEHKIVKEKLDDFVREKVDLSKRLATVDEQARLLEEEKKRLNSEKSGLEAEKQALQAEKAEMQKAQDTLQAESLELAKQVIPQDKLDAFKKKFASEVAQNRIIKLKMEQASEQLRANHVALATKDAELSALRAKLAEAVNSEKQALDEEHQRLGMENRIIREKVDSLIAELHQAEDEAKTAKDELAAVQADQTRLKATIADLHGAADTQASSQSDTVAALEKSNAGLKAEIETLKAQLAEAATVDAAENNVAGERDSLLAEVNNLRLQLADSADAETEIAEELGATNASLLKEIDELKAKLAAASTAPSDASTPATGMSDEERAELTRLRTEVSTLKTDLEAAKSAASEAAPAAATTSDPATPEHEQMILALKKHLAKAMAETKIMREKMGAMTEEVKSSREDSALAAALTARVAELEAAAAASAKEPAAAPAANPADDEARIRLETENSVLREQLNKLVDDLSSAQATLAAQAEAAKTGAAAPAPAAPTAAADAEALTRLQVENTVLREQLDKLLTELDEARKTTATAATAAGAAGAAIVAATNSGAPEGSADAAALKALREQITALDDTRKELSEQNESLHLELAKLQAEARSRESAPKQAIVAPTNLPAAVSVPSAAAAPATAPDAAAPDTAALTKGRLAELEQSNAELKAQIEKLSSDLDIARKVMEEEDAGDDKKKKSKSGAPGAKPDKMRLFEAMQENEGLKKDVERLRKRVKEERSDMLTGFVKPDISMDVDAMVIRNRELEHKLVVLEQERENLQTELADWRDDGVLNASNSGKGPIKLPIVEPAFPKEVTSTLKDIIGKEPILFAHQTTHKIDTGLWGRKSPCYLALTADSLVLVAPGKQELIEKLPRTRLKESFWNPVTRQVVFSPGVVNPKLPSISMSQELGRELLLLLQASRLEPHAEPLAPAAAAAPAATT